MRHPPALQTKTTSHHLSTVTPPCLPPLNLPLELPRTSDVEFDPLEGEEGWRAGKGRERKTGSENASSCSFEEWLVESSDLEGCDG